MATFEGAGMPFDMPRMAVTSSLSSTPISSAVTQALSRVHSTAHSAVFAGCDAKSTPSVAVIAQHQLVVSAWPA